MTPLILDWPAIEARLQRVDAIGAMERAFAAYSRGDAVIPPVGELQFEEPPGDVHIKYGYLRGGDHYVVKIASGFYSNPTLGLPSSQGLMLLFLQRTGQLAAVLLDEGRLTDLRTGAAGAVAAKYLAPREPTCIGIVGTGIQARCQLEQLLKVTPCRDVRVWGRDPEKVRAYLRDIEPWGVSAKPAATLETLASESNLIVTTTPAEEALLQADWIQLGTHITAVGSDTATKQELSSEILERADLVVADSRTQCRTRGEIHHALNDGKVASKKIVELGEVVSGRADGRTSDRQISVADLTGVAVQDLAIAGAVFEG